MRVLFEREAWDDLCHWIANDESALAKLLSLIENCRRTPFKGIGKPEPLKGSFAGFWSRRITGEHRLVYRVTGSGVSQTLEIAACRFHYSR